jgi:hypothetical protein
MDVPARCLWEVPLWILRGFIAPRYDAPNRIEGMFFRQGSSNRGQRGKDDDHEARNFAARINDDRTAVAVGRVRW